LNDLVWALFAAAFEGVGDVPKGLKGAAGTLKTTSIEERLKKVAVAVDADAFAAFRAKYEAEGASRAAAKHSSRGPKRQRPSGPGEGGSGGGGSSSSSSSSSRGGGSGGHVWSFARPPGADSVVASALNPMHGGTDE